MELLLLGLLAMGILGGNDSKHGKRRRRYHDSLGYYEHLYGQGHP